MFLNGFLHIQLRIRYIKSAKFRLRLVNLKFAKEISNIFALGLLNQIEHILKLCINIRPRTLNGLWKTICQEFDFQTAREYIISNKGNDNTKYQKN